MYLCNIADWEVDSQYFYFILHHLVFWVKHSYSQKRELSNKHGPEMFQTNLQPAIPNRKEAPVRKATRRNFKNVLAKPLDLETVTLKVR